MPRPVGDVILVEVPKLAEKTAGGIYIPDEVRDKTQDGSDIGIIRDLGPLAFNDHDEVPVKVGDMVHFRRYAGIYLKEIKDKEYRYITDQDIFGVADPEELSTVYEVE